MGCLSATSPLHVVVSTTISACVSVSRFLSDEDDGVSEAIIGFAVQYIGILKVRVMCLLCVRYSSHGTALIHTPEMQTPLY